MRRITTLAAIAALMTNVSAQLTVGGVPIGLQLGMDRTAVPTLTTGSFDATTVEAEDAQRAADGRLPLYSRLLEVNATPMNSGRWDVLPNGDRIWRLRLESKSALATELYFDQFELPANATLYVYDDQGEQLQGGFSAYNNKEHGQFSTGLVNGEASILEYYEPQNVAGHGGFRITHVGHAYRFVAEVKAADCEVDVKCSEGAPWWQQRNGVVRLSVVEPGGSGWCTGSVVNNVMQDCKPYILTAFHCGVNSTTANFNLWKAYFKYQRSGCGTGTAPTGSYMTGCVKRADSNDGGGNTGSDFLLIEMNDDIPNNFYPYFNGWNASNTASPSGVCIHHPAGDEKKVSTYSSNTINASWGGTPGTHWRVTWVATANGWGVTEGGSSGSPLFNNNGLIIGTLTGGASYCNSVVPGANDDPDYYGKVSYHWSSNPGAATEHLEEWLDPNGSGAMSLAGSFDPCGNYTGPVGEFEETIDEAPTVYPNPAVDVINVVIPEGVADIQRLDVMDLTGRLVSSVVPNSSDRLTIDTKGWSAGTYIVQLVADGVTYGGVRVTVTGR